jgi:hypothetical protein
MGPSYFRHWAVNFQLRVHIHPFEYYKRLETQPVGLMFNPEFNQKRRVESLSPSSKMSSLPIKEPSGFSYPRLLNWFPSLRTATPASSTPASSTPASSPSQTPHERTLTNSKRLAESLDDRPLDPAQLTQNVATSPSTAKETVLYLAYGSNLCRKSFRQGRGIRPISQVNVLVPELVLTFDLPGLPYTEPCFANTRYRTSHGSKLGSSSDHANGERYHKDAWHKGLVGVVYEVTLADYAHIIATEGGGASYEDVVVDCYVLPEDPNQVVPTKPSGDQLKAHTLFAPEVPAIQGGRIVRPHPSYAQASPRYLKLLRDGAEELRLPYEYQKYLHDLRGYKTTTTKQRLGKFIFLSIWVPLVLLVFRMGRIFADERGRYPPWLMAIFANVFLGIWTSYDHFFKDVFGDGERTMKPGCDESFHDEKHSLIPAGRSMEGFESDEDEDEDDRTQHTSL